MKFSDLNIQPAILKALSEENYETPTSIQEKAIPLVLAGHDVLGTAQTGTGKTAAFSIPVIQYLSEDSGRKRQIRALVLTPTRELAMQIAESVAVYSKYTTIKSTVIFGGVAQGPQVKRLKEGVDLLIATPGRLLDLIGQNIISLRAVSFFVLDEADRMLDMGFIHDIKKLIPLLPEERQSLFFSATMPDNILGLSKKILNAPRKVSVAPVSSTAETIKQYLYKTNKKEKGALLLHILNKVTPNDQVLVFSRTKHGADRIVKNLTKNKVDAAAIHGDKNQNQRQRALNGFKEGSVRVLVATDIAARGIDIKKLKYVINFDIPNEPETYVHRIGRSGRAGEEGVSISLCEPEENAYVIAVEKLTKTRLELVKDNPHPQTEKAMTAEEKKAFEKEKQRKKQEFFANRKKKGQGGGRSSNRTGSGEANKPNNKRGFRSRRKKA